MKQTSTLVKTSKEPNLLKPHGTGWHSVVHIALTRERAPNACSLQRCNVQPDRTGVRGNWVQFQH
jgi:hypothetical protein